MPLFTELTANSSFVVLTFR